MSNSTLLNDIGRFLLGILLVASLTWTLVAPSFESVISVLTAIAGIVASYKPLLDYQFWGRIALIVATVVSLIWVVTTPVWESIVSLLGCAVGAIASFSGDTEGWQIFPITVKSSSKNGSIPRGLLGLFAWMSWLVVWYVCLYWGFESYIPGLLLPITKMAAPIPQSWFIQNTQGFLLWIGLTGLIIILPISWNDEDIPFAAIFQAGFLAVIVSVISAWMSYLVYVAHGWNLGEIITALFAMILAHMLIVGFFASIGMAIFGIGVAIIWVGIMLMLVWATTLVRRNINQ